MNEKKPINPEGQKPLGPYSTALKFGNLIFISGQIPDDSNADIKEQTKQVMEKIKKQIEAAGGKIDDILQCTVFLSDLNDFSAMNEVYASYFKEPFPTRMAVEVSAIVKSVKVEIGAIAGTK